MSVAWLLFGIILTLVLVSSLPGLRAPFIFDDGLGIVENPSVFSLSPSRLLFGSPVDSTPYGRPIVVTSLSLNRLVTGASPFGFRLFNVVLHAANAMVLFLLLESLLAHQRWSRPHRYAMAAIVAGTWAVHPLTTNVSLYIVQRAEGLFAFCYLLVLYFAAQHLAQDRTHEIAGAEEAPEPIPATPVNWKGCAVVACAAGMLCKESMVTAPLAVYLMDAGIYSRSLRKPFQSDFRWYIQLASTWILLAFVMWTWPRSQSVGTGGGFSGFHYLKLQCEIIPGYFAKTFLPLPLHIDYWFYQNTNMQNWIGGAVLLTLALGTAVVLLYRGRLIGFLAVLFFLILAPTSSFVPVYSMTGAEYRMYMPLACLLAVLLLGFHSLSKLVWSGKPAMALTTVVCALLMAYFSTRTFSRAGQLANPRVVWQQVLDSFPDSPRALNELARFDRQDGKIDQAKARHRRAIELYPQHADAYFELGLLEAESGNLEEAQTLLKRSVELWPYNALALSNLAIVYASQKQMEKAESTFSSAIKLAPHLPEPHFNYAIFLLQQSKWNEGAAELQKVLAIAPGHERARAALQQLQHR